MKRRNFFKLIAGILGAAVVVPEIIKGALTETPEIVAIHHTVKDLDKDVFYYKNIPGPPLFTVVKVDDMFSKAAINVWIEADKHPVDSWKFSKNEYYRDHNYFRINDSIVTPSGAFILTGVECSQYRSIGQQHDIKLTLCPIRDKLPVIALGDKLYRSGSMRLESKTITEHQDGISIETLQIFFDDKSFNPNK